MSKSPRFFLEHILEAIELIERRIDGVTTERFQSDLDLQDMVVRRVEIIGEAVRNLSKEFRDTHPEINWKGPADMRSQLAHVYFDIDLDIVWDTVTNKLEPLKEGVRKLLADPTMQ